MDWPKKGGGWEGLRVLLKGSNKQAGIVGRNLLIKEGGRNKNGMSLCHTVSLSRHCILTSFSNFCFIIFDIRSMVLVLQMLKSYKKQASIP